MRTGLTLAQTGSPGRGGLGNAAGASAACVRMRALTRTYLGHNALVVCEVSAAAAARPDLRRVDVRSKRKAHGARRGPGVRESVGGCAGAAGRASDATRL